VASLFVNWKQLYIIFLLVIIALDFSGLAGQVRDIGLMEGDHGFHWIKFEMFRSHGIGDWEALGSVDFSVLVPPTLLPFLFLAKLIPAEIAYLLTYYLILGMVYLFARKFIPGKEATVVLVLLFTPSIFVYIHFGRLLEFMAQAAFITMLFYMDEGTPETNTILFILGLASHPPTAIFYAPMLALKSLEKGRKKQVMWWATIGVAWAILFLPKTIGTTGMMLPRVEELYMRARYILKNMRMMWVIPLSIAASIITLISLRFLGKEGRYALPSFLISFLPSGVALLNTSWVKYLPGINQVIPTTGIPLLSYLLMKKNENIWAVVSILLAFIVLFPTPRVNPYEEDLAGLDVVENGYVIIQFPYEQRELSSFVHRYLVGKDIPTPVSFTWEYSDPGWYFYYPESCADLKAGWEYVILPRDEQWAKGCGNWTETPNLLIVKPL
jgi:hypothetical protein